MFTAADSGKVSEHLTLLPGSSWEFFHWLRPAQFGDSGPGPTRTSVQPKARAEALLGPTYQGPDQQPWCDGSSSTAERGAEPPAADGGMGTVATPVPPTALPQAWDSGLALRLCFPLARGASHPQRPAARVLCGAAAAPRFPARLWRAAEAPAHNLCPSHPGSPLCRTGKATLPKERRATINNPGCFSGAICHKESQCAAVEPTVTFRYTTFAHF